MNFSLTTTHTLEDVMSIEIDWESLTTGTDGQALAVSIKDFIHDKFQQIELPRFIRSVEVHSFDFGKECPVAELKDISDPLPQFYEDDEDEANDSEEGESHEDPFASGAPRGAGNMKLNEEINTARHDIAGDGTIGGKLAMPPSIDTRAPSLRAKPGFAGHVTNPILSRAATPGIPGGTSNLSYFHLPLAAGLSGTQTPLAAVAGGTSYFAGWPEQHISQLGIRSRQHSPERYRHAQHEHEYADPSSRPSTADSYADIHPPQVIVDETTSERQGKRLLPDPRDLQIVLHISYSGTVSLSLTAEILLDYPMPSFVGIPLKLNITGLSFDGVALIAYLRKRAHFCFLGPEDAETLVGAEPSTAGHNHGKSKDEKMGGLLREIQVESEIGRKEGGKQVLKNLGKIEKFVLEQVRRIFEDEFVWPNYWTFLV